MMRDFARELFSAGKASPGVRPLRSSFELAASKQISAMQ
jgi:hypothetical protein